MYFKVVNRAVILNKSVWNCCQIRSVIKEVPLFGAAPLFRFYGSRNSVRALLSAGVSVGRHVIVRSSKSVFCNRRFYTTLLEKLKVDMPEVQPFERLPASVVPKHYALVLTPDLKLFTFKGESSVQLEVGLTYARIPNLT